ncbi:MAG TPA: PA0069 family radical SAM protein [Planctomycetota bacterium]|nr:PA0069 family radical SAM protein [Planctomycetota bacterium]
MALKLLQNPPNPWHSEHVEWIDAPPPEAKLEIYEEEAKTVLSENDSPDVGFRWSLNPYRGCFHACAYCYARPTHQYWDFGAGTDFERKIIVKINAAEKLREAFWKKSWVGERVVFSGNTDCYQPLEASYGITRACLEVCREFRNPIGMITKSALIQRDAALIGAIAREAQAHVHISIAFADNEMARKIEPNAPSPEARFGAMRSLAREGVPVGVAVAPIIPGLNDTQVAEVLERAKDAGATAAFRVMLRLPAEVKPVFIERLTAAYPDRANKVLNAVKEMRGGKLYDSRFGVRGNGAGERWQAIDWLFELTCKRLGLNVRGDMQDPEPPKTFTRPLLKGAQLELF